MTSLKCEHRLLLEAPHLKLYCGCIVTPVALAVLSKDFLNGWLTARPERLPNIRGNPVSWLHIYNTTLHYMKWFKK